MTTGEDNVLPWLPMSIAREYKSGALYSEIRNLVFSYAHNLSHFSPTLSTHVATSTSCGRTLEVGFVPFY